jgi:hypothetical protein
MTDSSTTVLQALSDTGLLLLQDKRLPNVVTLLTGETLRSSWWSHAKGGLIFAVVTKLSDHPDVLIAKLLQGKVTFVHRRLWPAFLAVASAGEEWQVRGLSAEAARVLVDANEANGPIQAVGPAVKELEARLLAHTEEVHGEMGRHEVMVQPWAVWAKRVKVKPLRSIAAAREQLEEAAQAIGAGPASLPWRSKKNTKKR